MSKWRQTSIGAFIDFNPSESIKKGKVARKIPMDKLGTFQRKIIGSEYSEYSAGPKFRNEDTIVAKITPCLENGKTAFVDILDDDEVAFGSSEFIVLRANDNSDPKFIYYLARSPIFRERAISCMEGTSGRKRVNEGALKRQEILVPESKLTQQKIASILSALDDKIELNNRINTELEKMAKTLYDYWFVQFDFPDKDGKPYKSSGGKMVYNEVLKREIPEGWEVKRLGDVANITMGQSPSGTSYNEEKNGLIFFQGSTDFGWRYPENRVYTTAPSRFAKEDDILLSVRAPIGTMNLAMNNCCIGRGLSALNSKDNFGSFLIYQMNYFKKKFDYLNSVGTTFGSLTKDELYGLELTYPSKRTLKEFENILAPLDEKIKLTTRQNQELSALRDWLLPMLMNGQVKVAEAEGTLEQELGMVAERTR